MNFYQIQKSLQIKCARWERQRATRLMISANFKPILERARELAEVNPMMGHRGVRVAVTYPEIYEMQITAVFEAVAQMSKRETKGVAQIRYHRLEVLQN